MKQIQTTNKKIINYILIIIILFSIFIRLANINMIPAFDEFTQFRATSINNEFGLEETTEIPPLTTWTRVLFTDVFGFSVPVLRLISILFSSGTAILLFLIVKERHSENAAKWAVIILLISSWFTLGSISISFTGPFLLFYMVLMFFFFNRYLQQQKNIYLILTGLAYGLATLTKFEAVLMFVVIAFESYFSRKEILTTIKELFVIGSIGVICFSIFPLLAYLSDFSLFLNVLSHTTGFNFRPDFNFYLLLVQYVLAIIWIGPFFLIGLFLKHKQPSKNYIYYFWIIFILVFYTIGIQSNFRPLERYLFPILIPLVILSALKMSEINFSKKYLTYFLLTTIFGCSLFVILNIFPSQYIGFYPKSNFLTAILNFDLFFEFPFTGDQGPIGFYLDFFSILIYFVISIFISVLIFFQKCVRNPKILIIILLGLYVAFNVVLQAEMSFSVFHDDVNEATKNVGLEANKILMTNPSANWFVYRQSGLKALLPYSEGLEPSPWDDQLRIRELKTLNVSNSYVFFVDFPRIQSYKPVEDLFNRCTIIYSTPVQDPIGFILYC